MEYFTRTQKQIIMTIEQKAKAYDEAVEKLRSLHDDYDTVSTLINIKEELENIFPELKESEDERIRKELLNAFQVSEDSLYMVLTPQRRKSFIAWLEKQGEQKTTLPIWKYKNDNLPLLRDSLILNKYGCVAKLPSGAIVCDVWVIDYAELAKLPKEEVEKQGEQKPADNEMIEILRTEYEKGRADAIAEMQNPAWSDEDEKMIQDIINDIAIAQEQVYCKSRCEEEINWVKSIKARVQPKQEWGKDDETALGDALWCCKQAASIAKDENDMGNIWYAENWLKSLKDRVHLKQEWSEEDETKLKSACALIRNTLIRNTSLNGNKDIIDSTIDWLKSLKDRYTWKPSDEQMEGIECTIKTLKYQLNAGDNRIDSLYADLKKLKGE